jgi:hypothetical protein
MQWLKEQTMQWLKEQTIQFLKEQTIQWAYNTIPTKQQRYRIIHSPGKFSHNALKK